MGSAATSAVLALSVLLLGLASASGAGIISWQLTSKLAFGESLLSVQVQNSGEKEDFMLEARIKFVNSLEYYGIAAVPNLDANETREIVFSQHWIPEVSGSYVIELTLLADASEEPAAQLIDSFSIVGKENYEIYAKCFQDSLQLGDSLDANILIANIGSVYEDAELEWHLLDSKNNKINGGKMPLAIYPGKFREVSTKEQIPLTSKPGLYKFSAELRYNSETKSASCALIVEAYDGALDLLKNKMEKLQSELELSKSKARSSSTAYASLAGNASLLGIGIAIAFIAALLLLYFRSKKHQA